MNIRATKHIDAPIDALWAYLADYSNIHKFHPLLNNSFFVDGSDTCELGATRQCDFKDGNYIKERVIEWKEGSHYTIDIYETSMPLKTATASLGLNEINEKQTEAYMHLNLNPKYWYMRPMMYLMFRYVAAPKILNGLAKLYEEEHQLAIA